jgi:hypothetical protein
MAMMLGVAPAAIRDRYADAFVKLITSSQERIAECEPWEFMREYLYYLQYGNATEPLSDMVLEHLTTMSEVLLPVAFAAKSDDDYKQVLSIGVELVCVQPQAEYHLQIAM